MNFGDILCSLFCIAIIVVPAIIFLFIMLKIFGGQKIEIRCPNCNNLVKTERKSKSILPKMPSLSFKKEFRAYKCIKCGHSWSEDITKIG